MKFPDRRKAGELLGELVKEANPPNPVVLSLPRGGVPVGFEVALRLRCELDVLVVRKLGVPAQPELAMGAIGEQNVIIRNDEIAAAAGVGEKAFDRVVLRERAELERRVSTYREVAEPIDPVGCTAIVVDDGLATGSTAAAGIAILVDRGVEDVWLAVPVAPRETARAMERLASRVVVLSEPPVFGAVGSWYRDFRPTSDDEVRTLLTESRLR
jgi:putative phosphoribosyl transferase